MRLARLCLQCRTRAPKLTCVLLQGGAPPAKKPVNAVQAQAPPASDSGLFRILKLLLPLLVIVGAFYLSKVYSS